MSTIKRCRDDVYIAFKELFTEWQVLEADSNGDPQIAKIGSEFVVPACRANADLISALDEYDKALDSLVQFGIEV